MPPMGEIHPSVLKAVGEIFGFAALGAIVKAIDKGMNTTIKHNNTELTIHKEKDSQ